MVAAAATAHKQKSTVAMNQPTKKFVNYPEKYGHFYCKNIHIVRWLSFKLILDVLIFISIDKWNISKTLFAQNKQKISKFPSVFFSLLFLSILQTLILMIYSAPHVYIYNESTKWPHYNNDRSKWIDKNRKRTT